MTAPPSPSTPPSPLARVEHDPRLLRREWRFERAGWFAIALVLVMGFAGVFGSGAASNASGATPDGAALLRYERIVRHGAPTGISLRLAPSFPGDSVAVVSLDEDYLASLALTGVLPIPLDARSLDGRVEYRFGRDPARATTVEFFLIPGSLGGRSTTVRTSHGTLVLRQIVLP